MPVPSFLASFADKAQSAINASPLAAHLPSSSSSPDPATQPSANEAASQGAPRSHTFGSLQHQLRAFGQQYAPTTPVQKIITIEKSVAIDFDSVSRDSKAQSKELYTWGQTESEDLKDVTDRLAYLNFVQGSLASSLAVKLDSSRAPFKALRDAEASLAPRRNIRAGMQIQLSKLEHDQQKGNESRIVELREQIRKAELDDQAQEKEVELLKRKAVRESERLKWEAVREYGEKLVLLSQAATPIIGALPSIPPSPTTPYTGAQATGAARASLQRALDNYKTGHINLPSQLSGADLHRSDTRSFGESHASELSSIASEATSPGISTTPPQSTTSLLDVPAAAPKPEVNASHSHATPINPAALNQSPASIPAPISVAGDSANQPPPSAPAPAPQSPISALASSPTVAETGVPVTAGAGGPGPASGSLHDIHNVNLSALGSESKHTSAEEEKKRLHAAYSQTATASQQPQPGPGAGAGASSPHHESAEEEKKRLEREERERLLRNNTIRHGASGKDREEDLPPYQPM